MTTDDIEASLRDALAWKAAAVPAHAADRLMHLDYRPRAMRRPPTAAAALATAVLAAAGGYLASSLPASDATTPVSLAAFRLPAGYTATSAPCAPLPPGIGAPRAAHSEAGLAAGAVRPPSGATPTPVGRYEAFMTKQTPDQTITLYIATPAAKGAQELVIVARNLSASQVIDIARRTLRTR